MTRARPDIVGVFGTPSGLLPNAWYALCYLGWAFVVPTVIGPHFGQSDAAWYRAWSAVAPFLVWLTANIAGLASTIKTQTWVYLVLTGAQILAAALLWIDAASAATAAGRSPLTTPVFVLTTMAGGWIVCLATVSALVTIAVEMWIAGVLSIPDDPRHPATVSADQPGDRAAIADSDGPTPAGLAREADVILSIRTLIADLEARRWDAGFHEPRGVEPQQDERLAPDDTSVRRPARAPVVPTVLPHQRPAAAVAPQGATIVAFPIWRTRNRLHNPDGETAA